MSYNNSEHGLYIQLYSIHGLVRGHDMELGRDADTGGQVKYVVELGNALSANPHVDKVELFTRWMNDKKISTDYSVPIEKINDKFSIIRIRCGGSRYIRKELLWPHLDEFVDRCIRYIKESKRIPDIIHSHYADAGYVGMELSGFFGLPLIHTGHSLGKNKQSKLLNDGLSIEEIDKRFNMNHRIEVEEDVIYLADLIITSTQQEIQKQYGEYKNSSPGRFVVIPPGVDLDIFRPPAQSYPVEDETAAIISKIIQKFNRFFMHIDKPPILTVCRPDKKKNIAGLITAFGEDPELQNLSNLAIFAGIREDIQTMPDNEKEVLTEMLLLMDKYNLYGKMAIPKRHDTSVEIPELYRLTAASHGVFINAALTEPFGLTLIEAAASGLPVVATNDGGPKDIIGNLQNGILVDVTEPKNIAEAIKIILNDHDLWNTYSANGLANVKKFYSWDAHINSYLKNINKLITAPSSVEKHELKPVGRKVMEIEKLIITDIDHTLLGSDEALQKFNSLLLDVQDRIGFGVATGRTVESASEVLKANNVSAPIVILSSVGTEIYFNYHGKLSYSKGWDTHLSYKWNRKLIVDLLSKLGYLTMQEEETQRKFKISYFMNDDPARLDEIKNILIKNKIKAKIIFSGGNLLDILPYLASKGKAVRYLALTWNIPFENILVAGDSGNDIDMLKGEMPGVVVGNYAPEMENIKGIKRVYFAKGCYADGIIEGIGYYNFLKGKEQNA
jgi:sucrose-phosphate synthase